MKLLRTTMWICSLITILLPGKVRGQVNSYSFTQTSSLNPETLDGLTYIVDDYVTTTQKRRRLFLNDVTSSAGSATGKGFPIGFDFLYDGQTMNSFGVSANGYLKLGDSLQGITMLNDTSFFSFYAAHPERKNTIAGFMRKSYKLPNFNNNMIRIKYGLSGYPGEQVLSVTSEKLTLITQSPLVLYQTLSYTRLYQFNNKVEVVNKSDISTSMAKDTALVGLLGSSGIIGGNFATRKVAEGVDTWKISSAGTPTDGYCEYSNSLRPVHTSGFNPLGISYSWVPAPLNNVPKCPEAYFKQTLPGNSGYIQNVTAAYILAKDAVEVELNQTLFWSPEYSDSTTFYDLYFGIDSLSLINLASNITSNSYQLPPLAAQSKYYYKVIAHNAFGTSNSCVHAFTTGNAIQYCTPLFPGNTAYQNFSLNTMTYTAPGTSDPQASYPAAVYHTNLKRDTGYVFRYTAMTGVPCFTFRLWIDFNQNGILNDAGEYFSGNNFSIPVPHNASLGPTKMRIGIIGTCSPSIPDPCFLNKYQDFVVTIVPATACGDFNLNPLATLPLCFDENSGSIALNPTGGQTPYTFAWLKNNSVFFETTATASNISSATYQCKVTDANNCILQTAVIPLYQSMPLTIDTNLVSGTMTVVASGGTAPYQFEWDNGTATYTSNPPPGTYSLTATDAHGCNAQLLNVVVPDSVTAGMDASVEEPSLWLYPNPGKGIFTLFVSNIGEYADFTLADISGAIVRKQGIFDKETTIDLSGQRKGIYFMKINSGNTNKVIKLILY